MEHKYRTIFLGEELKDFSSVLFHLAQKDIISADQRQSIKSKFGSERQTQLFDILMHSYSKERWGSVKNIFMSTGNQYILHKMEDLLKTSIIRDTSNRIVGFVSQDGKIENSTFETLGYIRLNGAVDNGKYARIGYIRTNGVIENENYIIGHIWPDGTVEDCKFSFIGRIRDNGNIENRYGQIGHCENLLAPLNRKWLGASVFFFFSFNLR